MSEIGLAIGVLKIGKAIYERQVEHYLLPNIFKQCGANVKKLTEDCRDENSSKVRCLFSDDNLEKWAQACHGLSGFEIIDYLNAELKNFFNQFDLKDFAIDRYIAAFNKELKYGIAKADQELATQIFLKEYAEKANKEHAEILAKLEYLIEKEKKVDDGGVTLYEEENILRNASQYHIDFGFYDYAQSNVDQEIITTLQHNSCINVQAATREEALYYTLRVLKYQSEWCDKVLIVRKVDCWEKLSKLARDKILLCYFYGDQPVQPLPGNKTVFITGSADELAGNTRNIIKVPNRTRRQLYFTLKAYVGDSEKPDHLIKLTGGIYSALKRHIFITKYNVPQWSSLPNQERLAPAVLLQEWCDNEGDKRLIAELAGVDAESYTNLLLAYKRVDEP